MTAQQALEIARKFSNDAGYQFFFLQAVQHHPDDTQWRVIFKPAVLATFKEVWIDDATGEVRGFGDLTR